MTLAAGTILGPYQIVSQLGSGGMGIVYEAKDPRLKRTVAIKLLPPDLTKDDTAKQRFLQEAKPPRRWTTPTSGKKTKRANHHILWLASLPLVARGRPPPHFRDSG